MILASEESVEVTDSNNSDVDMMICLSLRVPPASFINANRLVKLNFLLTWLIK